MVWNGIPLSVQIAALLGNFSVVWLAAGFLDSQLRNLVQLFEGYTLIQLSPRLAGRAQEWHSRHKVTLDTKKRVLKLGDESMGSADITDNEIRQLLVEAGEPGGYSEERWVLYSGREGDVLPTRFGNVIRAAEDYSRERYGADYLKIWPRLAHVCSERFVQDYEAARSSVDFLLVTCLLSCLFGIIGGVTQIFCSVHPLAFLATVGLSFVLSLLSYSSAVEAAKEYGEQMRASMDLFRIDLLTQLRYAPPRNREEEIQCWQEFERFFLKGQDRITDYSDPDSPATVS